MTILTKAIAGILALGTTIGGGLLLTQSSLFSKKKTTLKDLVEKDKWTFLTTSNTQEIAAIQEAYKKTTTPTVTLKFSNLTGNENDFATKLLQTCQSSYEKESDTPSKEELLKQLKKWCVVPKTVNQRLADLEITLLSTEDPSPSNTETEAWKKKGRDHNSDQTTSNEKFNSLTMNGDENANATSLRNRCKKELEVKSFEEEFQDILEKVKSWCAN